MAKPLIIYSIDTSSLIHAWRRAYPPANFPQFWKRFDELIEAKRMFACAEVLRDLKRKDDDVYAWAKARAPMFLPIDVELQRHVSEVMQRYQRLVDTSTGRSAADPFVIALARMKKPPWTVVSEEHTGKKNSPKIPDVCLGEGIPRVNLVELIQQEGWVLG